MQPAGKGFPSLQEIKSNPVPDKLKKKARRDLGLDLSSSCVGWGFGVNKKVKRYGKFVFKTTAGTGEKLLSYSEFLRVVLSTYKPDRLLVEKPPTRRGATTSRHFELMGVTRAVWREQTGTEILDSWLISPLTIKRVIGVRRGGNHSENKRIMVNEINSLYQLNLNFHENSRYKSDDDIADALAVLTTAWGR